MNPQFAATDISSVLGLKGQPTATSPFSLMETIDRGLPVAALDRVAGLVAPDDALFKYRVVPKASYGRRRTAHRLSAEEGLKLTRLARVWSLARDVWKTDASARDFLFRPHAMLQGNKPVEVALRNEIGTELVLDILSRLKYGVAA
ncbi:antitoxin [Camelimonas fluminis]|uniref:Antitoxin Xre/MbcA/ParS toxin-binding domain-containing protein n=1 Tax=Camelimonas fluminis TaxID=1576911 RepID=A0ABV7UBT0_9HYPH|nr:antitoxin Xre/MbcA/ParS toxin-binding domain-containing protein [Camelimonas fluminis]GHE77800.1 antitoxin [Camelimonas fluminis]